MHKILIVDDEKPSREFIATLIAGYLPDSEIIKVSQPQTAIDCFQNEDFDILFLDICMPGMTGLDLLEDLKRKGKHPYTVLVSAYHNFDYAIKGIELGVVQYLTKPLFKEKVFEALDEYLKHVDTNTILLTVPQGIRRVKIKQIHAIQTVDRSRVKIYASDIVIPCATGTLGKLYPGLPAHFHYIRRNCILNFSAITEYNLKSREVVINCQNEKISFQVSRDKVKELTTWLKDK